jgi:hypothetical protein
MGVKKTYHLTLSKNCRATLPKQVDLSGEVYLVSNPTDNKYLLCLSPEQLDYLFQDIANLAVDVFHATIGLERMLNLRRFALPKKIKLDVTDLGYHIIVNE